MAFVLPEPIPLESFDRIDIDSFSCDMQSLQFSFVLSKYIGLQRVRTQTILVPQSALMDYMTRPLTGDTMYGAMKRMLWEYAKKIDQIPDNAVDDELAAQTDVSTEPAEIAGQEGEINAYQLSNIA